MPESLSFERAAETYDETRGGLVRGRIFAAAISAQLRPSCRILEIGVGTGAIALPLTELGHTVVGVDISPAMLARAYDRLGPSVTIADGGRLPIATASFDAIVAVWVLHLVADRDTVLAECGRVLRPGGRLAVVDAAADEEPNDVGDILMELRAANGRPYGVPDDIGLAPVHRGPTDFFEFDESPNETIRVIESRTWSWLWDLDDEEWAARVQPHIDRLASLPEPDRPRHRRHSHPLLVLEK